MYLETGKICARKCSNSKVSNRRMLHCAFWQHGANNIMLPSWWSSVLPHLPSESENAFHDNHYSQSSCATTEPMLDFLYPRQAIDFFKNFHNFRTGSLKKNKRRQLADLTLLRQYSSAAVENGAVTSNGSVPLVNEIILGTSEGLVQLKKLLQGDDSEHDNVWELYSNLPIIERSQEVNIATLRYISTSPTNTNAQRCVFLFGLLTKDGLEPWVFRTAVLSNILVERIDNAITTHHLALQHLIDGDVGSSLLFAHLVFSKQWSRAMELHHLFVNSQTSTGAMRKEKLLWEDVAQVEDLRDVRDSFITFVEDSIHEEDALRLSRHRLFQGLCIHAFPVDIKRNAEEVHDLLAGLDRKKFPTGEIYSHIVMNCLRAQPGRTQYNRDNTFTVKAWQMWRCNSNEFRPTEQLLYKFLRELCWDKRTVGPTSVKAVASVWREQYSKLTNEALLLLMQTYAKLGDSEEVYKYFREYEQNNKEMPMTYEPFKRLALLHGQRGEVEECTRLFSRMRTVYRKEPKRYFWNMLVLACAKNNDLDGCYRVLEEIEQNGMYPNAVTLGPIMNILAQRGDVIAVRNFLRLAEERKTRISTHMVGALVLAHINNNELDTAETLAKEAAEVKQNSPEKLDGSLTKMWNTLLTAYALRKDDKTVSRLFKRMLEYSIEPDELTFATFMQTMAGKNQTQTAEIVFRRVLTINNIRVTAFHYAILMVGYINQGMYERAITMNKKMKRRGIKDNANTRMALIKATALLNAKHNKSEDSTDKGDRLEVAENVLHHTVNIPNSYHKIDSGPSIGLKHEGGISLSSMLPASYLMMLYSKKRLVQAARELFDKHIRTTDGSVAGQADESLRLLTAVMRMYRLEQDWSSLEECWNIAKKKADHLAVMPEAKLPYQSVEALLLRQTKEDEYTKEETVTYPKSDRKSSVHKVLAKADASQARFNTIYKELKAIKTDYTTPEKELQPDEVEVTVTMNTAKPAVVNDNIAGSEGAIDDEQLNGFGGTAGAAKLDSNEAAATMEANPSYQDLSSSSTEPSPFSSNSADEPIEPLRIAPTRATIISRPLAVYLRGLASQERFADIAKTVCAMLQKGYSLDMHAWNTFIEVLARGGFIETACVLCERVLMGAWTGWRNRANLKQFGHDGARIEPPLWLRKRRTQAQGLLFTNKKWPEPGVLMPYYRTFVFLHQQFLILQEKGVLDQDNQEDENDETGAPNADKDDHNFGKGSIGVGDSEYKDVQDKTYDESHYNYNDNAYNGGDEEEEEEIEEERTIRYEPHKFLEDAEPMAGESDAEIEDLYENPSLNSPEAAAAAIVRAPSVGPAMCPFILASMESTAPPTYKRLTNLAPQTVMAAEDLPPVPDRLQEVYLKRFEGY